MGIVLEQREVTKEMMVPSSAFCDRCRKELDFVMEGATNVKLAAYVKMEGWYGGFVDMHVPKYLLCEDCCRKFLKFVGETEEAW